MIVIYLQLIGAIIFFLGTIYLTKLLREKPDKPNAEKTSRISHFLYWSCLVAPGTLSFIYPGITKFDDILLLTKLPFPGFLSILGDLLLIVGLYYMIASNKSLAKLGRGAAAFKLTKKVVEGDIYKRVRNPMSLGYYLLCVGLGLAFNSTYFTFGSLFVIIPVHIFNLKYFEERELAIRHGESYLNYRESTPFIIPNFKA